MEIIIILFAWVFLGVCLGVGFGIGASVVYYFVLKRLAYAISSNITKTEIKSVACDSCKKGKKHVKVN